MPRLRALEAIAPGIGFGVLLTDYEGTTDFLANRALPPLTQDDQPPRSFQRIAELRNGGFYEHMQVFVSTPGLRLTRDHVSKLMVAALDILSCLDRSAGQVLSSLEHLREGHNDRNRN
ncbi:hypothetical protein OEZ60_07695 [Defluviimonas sp. WL0024]|uniref:Uncharacterized protein n=1 Tax=Albidovulum salinarum TaxID=2984153 RepID=A0ABT2X1R6_9RHOB|nr:hypothetical protein [Defluviimonas sp. WL0024]MCU9847888.1 hypothetical protein [Defluviimonas sp. WL0024]